MEPEQQPVQYEDPSLMFEDDDGIDHWSLHENDVNLEDLLLSLWRARPGGTESDCYWDNWGFTIYRTAYGGDTNQAWQALLKKIEDDVAAECAYYKEYREVRSSVTFKNPEAADKFISLFKMDPRSNPDLLNDATMEQVREIYQKGVDGPPIVHQTPQYHLFLLADAEVLSAIAKGEFWMKCVQGTYKAEDHYVKDYSGVQTMKLAYHGYIKMTVQSLLVLWDRLAIRHLEELSPTYLEEPLRIWDGDW